MASLRGWCLLLSLCATLAALPTRVQAQSNEAQRLFLRGAAAYGDGRHAEAADLFEQAYALSSEPALLYNLGLAREQAGEVDAAIAAYERFLADTEDAPERSEVERSLARLQRQRDLERELEEQQRRAAEEAAAAAAATPEPEPEVVVEDESRPSPGPWIVGGVGVATLVVGATLTGLAQARYATAEDLDTPHRRAAELERQANTFSPVGVALLVVGGVVTAAGLTWLLLTRDDDDGDREVVLRVGPGSIGVAGRF